MTDTKLGGITGKGFSKGDPRINRNGRPKSFDALRELGKQLGNEIAADKLGQPLNRDGHLVTQIEAILLTMMRDNPERFVEIAYGKVPMPVEMTGPGGGPMEQTITHIYIPDNQR